MTSLTTPLTPDRAPRGSVGERLRALIERDIEAGDVQTSRNGLINRKHYATILGCTPGALTFHVDLLAEYETKLKVVTGPMRHLAGMRAWLTAAYEAGELGVRDGKADRQACMEQFGLKGGAAFTRFPEIRELFEEFDARVARYGYAPSARREVVDRVRELLAGDVELNTDRLTINRQWLASTVQVVPHQLRGVEIIGAIQAREAGILAAAKESRIDPLVHGRVFTFSDLLQWWPGAFLEQVGRRFKLAATSPSKEGLKGSYLQLHAAMLWIGRSANAHCRAVVSEAMERSRVVSEGPWEEALFAYRDHLLAAKKESKVSTESAVDVAIKALRAALKMLSSGNLVPKEAVALPGVKHARRKSGHLRSVAEVGQSDVDYVGFAREQFALANQAVGSDMGVGDAQPFLVGLAAELGATTGLSADPASAIKVVLQRRLTTLRDHAVAILDKAKDAFRLGEELLREADMDVQAFARDYFEGDLGHHARLRLVHDVFRGEARLPDGRDRRGLANLLALIAHRHGRVPPCGVDDTGGTATQFWAKRYREFGGLSAVEAMLIPTPDAVGAALTLYLIEAGANVSVGRTLDRACLEDSDLPDHRRIAGTKARAKGKPIIVDLPAGSPAVRAIEWLLHAGAVLTTALVGDDADRLMLMRMGSRVQLMTPHWYNNWFKGFVASSDLSGLDLTPNMLRPSVLLHAALSDDGRLRTGLAIAQHTVGVSQGYQQKWPTRLLYDDNIRRFQAAFEALVMSGIEDAASRLGITAAQFEERLGHLRASGLGTFCRDGRGRPGTQTATCQTVDCWNDCPHLLIVAEVDAIAHLQLWQASLRAAQPEWERDRPERWDGVWLPWLCLTDVVREKMARGPLLATWNAAVKRAAAISSQPGYVAPRPW